MGRQGEKDGVFDNLIETNTPLYSRLGLAYQQAYSGPYGPLDFSGIVAALQEGRITGYGRPVVGDLTRKESRRLYDISPNILYLDFLEGGLSCLSRFLLENGAAAVPYYTQIIDLTKSEEALHAGLRKSYTSIINADIKNARVLSYRMGTPITSVKRIVCKYMPDLHKKVSGRTTRSAETWETQYCMFVKGEAFATITPGDFNAFALFLHNEHACYYGVGASLPDVNTHALVWKGILHAKSIGCKTMELGEQRLEPSAHPMQWHAAFPIPDDWPSFEEQEKLRNISKFKAGFGGITKCRLLIKSGSFKLRT